MVNTEEGNSQYILRETFGFANLEYIQLFTNWY